MPTMASRVSTMSLVCEPVGVSLRCRHMYFGPWLLFLISFATARLTSSLGLTAGGPAPGSKAPTESASATSRIGKAVRNRIGFMGSERTPLLD